MENSIDYHELSWQECEKRKELKQKLSIAHIEEIVVSTLEKPIVGTIELSTGNGIIFYDRENKKAWIGHGHASSSIKTLSKMLNYIKK